MLKKHSKQLCSNKHSAGFTPGTGQSEHVEFKSYLHIVLLAEGFHWVVMDGVAWKPIIICNAYYPESHTQEYEVAVFHIVIHAAYLIRKQYIRVTFVSPSSLHVTQNSTPQFSRCSKIW